MANPKKDKRRNKDKKDEALAPDPETLHTTDPQEKMEGPVSSVIQNIKEEAKKTKKKIKRMIKRKPVKSVFRWRIMIPF
jgi:hypothetical protein